MLELQPVKKKYKCLFVECLYFGVRIYHHQSIIVTIIISIITLSNFLPSLEALHLFPTYSY